MSETEKKDAVTFGLVEACMMALAIFILGFAVGKII